MVHMVFDYIIVDGASLRPTLGTGLNVYVGHDLLSLGSFCRRNKITQSLNRCQPRYLHSAARCLAGSSQQATKLSPAWGQDGASKTGVDGSRLQLENLFFGYLKTEGRPRANCPMAPSLVE
jgi:hypothetical protein